MPSPIVSWYKHDNSAEVLNWDLSVVDAGTISPEYNFLIWNNRGGSSNVSDMTSCTITTKDVLGGNTGEVVENKWIEAKCISLAVPDTEFTPIGGTAEHPIGASGGVDNFVISGAANNGIKDNSLANFAEIVVRANVPALATSGQKNFLLRVIYHYI